MTTTASSSSVDSSDRRPSGQPVSWRRLMRVARIEHRAALITVLIAFVVLVIAIIIGRDAVNAGYASYLAAGCTLAHPNNLEVCANTGNQFADIPSFTPLVIALRLFPLIIGAFVGAPLIAREVESGTYRFAWTQGAGRTRLLLVTLAMLALIVTLVAVALGLLLGGWYIHPYDVINVAVGSHWQAGLFTTTWWMTPVWTLFALALGTFVGALVKRTVAAIAATALIVGGVLVGVSQFLPRILDIGAVASSRVALSDFLVGTINMTGFRGVGPAGSFLVSGWFTGPGGKVIVGRAANTVRDHLIRLSLTKDGANDPHAATRWLALHHYTYWLAYQPADHFWILQAVIGLVVLAIAALCCLAAMRCIRGRRA
jgi:ABC-type transport system involved in multi-copper enzyme maturation permease subunit